MKKLLLTFLVALTGVMTASAAKLYVWLNENASSFLNSNPRVMVWRWNTENDGEAVEMEREFKYGFCWFSCELNDKTNAIIVRQNPDYGTSTSIDWNTNDNNNKVWNEVLVSNTGWLNTSEDNYVELWWHTTDNYFGASQSSERPKTGWSGLCVRSSVDGFTGYENNMVCSNGNNTFTKEYKKADFGESSTFTFRLKHIENVIYGEDGTRFNNWTQIGPSSDNTVLDVPSTISTVNQFYDATTNNWQIVLPTYDYEKIVITADYVSNNGAYEWNVSADAYIAKTVTAENQYATFGATVPVDLSSISGVTAYTATADASTGKVSLTEKTGTLAANEGVLLENEGTEDAVLSIRVAASAEASASNDLMAFTGSGNLIQMTETGYTNYILAKENDVVGFYKVNGTYGNEMGANTAYLHVKDAAGSARSYFSLLSDATSIDAVQTTVVDGQAYNLAGQRVAQPVKGLYIVNGKKVIMK